MTDTTDPSWDGQERRQTTLTLREIRDEIESHIASKLEIHALQEKRDKDEIMAELRALRALLVSAFPGDDPAGHRRHHEESIEFYKDMKMLALEVRNHTIKGVVWGGLILVCLAVWQFVKAKVGTP